MIYAIATVSMQNKKAKYAVALVATALKAGGISEENGYSLRVRLFRPLQARKLIAARALP